MLQIKLTCYLSFLHNTFLLLFHCSTSFKTSQSLKVPKYNLSISIFCYFTAPSPHSGGKYCTFSLIHSGSDGALNFTYTVIYLLLLTDQDLLTLLCFKGFWVRFAVLFCLLHSYVNSSTCAWMCEVNLPRPSLNVSDFIRFSGCASLLQKASDSCWEKTDPVFFGILTSSPRFTFTQNKPDWCKYCCSPAF